MVAGVSYKSANGSDHVAVGSVISTKKAIQSACQPVPRWLAEHPLMRDTFARIADKIKFDELEPFVALRVIKVLIRKASSLVAKAAFKRDVNDPSIRMQLVLQFSRALAAQDARLANKVMLDLPELTSLVDVSAGLVSITNHDKLDALTQDIVRQGLSHEIDLAGKTNGKRRPRGGRNAALHRQSLLWAPFAKKAVNVAIIRADGSVTATDEEKASELGNFWGKTFAKKEVDVDESHRFLQEFGHSFQLQCARLPGQHLIEFF